MVTDIPRSQVTIMKAVEEAVLALEHILTHEYLPQHLTITEQVRSAKDNLVRALGDLQKLRKGLGEVEDSIVAMGCEISGH